MPFKTDEHLKSYLDANQLHREQLCLAILSMDSRFSEVRPRHPRGGPDQGRDIEAKFEGEQSARAAIGFLNQADDSTKSRTKIKTKFKSDCKSALTEDPKPKAFVFLTNINLTITEKSTLNSFAKNAGFAYSEIFDRERIRIALDEPDGFAARFQYLGIPLSEAEQSSFFAKWGKDIQSVISTGFQSIKSTLDRIIFLQEINFPLRHMTVVFELDKEYRSTELGHFRIFASLLPKKPKHNKLHYLFGCFDRSKRMNVKSIDEIDLLPSGFHAGMGGGQWEMPMTPLDQVVDKETAHKEHDYERTSSFESLGQEKMSSFRVQFSQDLFIRFFPMLDFVDLDEASFLPILNKSIAEKLKSITVYANEYRLLKIVENDFTLDTNPFDLKLEKLFSRSELEDPWARIRPKVASMFHIRFSEVTPARFFQPTQLKV